ncbi:MAG: T9SS type A sorting domain-containing protein [Marinoscillum sp.]
MKSFFFFCLLLLGFMSGFGQCQYDKSKTITIDNSQVSGSSDFVDFPVYITFTDPDFRSTANGGYIQNSNGYDIKLMLNSCRCWIDFIIHSFDATTGAMELYASVPALKANEPTKLEIYFGNAAVSANPSSDTTYNSTRTANWIATQNANRNTPSTFYSIGARKEANCTGPGGVDQMDGTSNLVLWLKADCGVEDGSSHTVLDGGAVGTWRDQSGFDIDATEATNRPDYQEDQVQGNPALNFTAGNGDRLLAAGVSDADEYMIFIVAEPNSYASNNIGLVHAAPTGEAFSGTTTTKSIGMWVSNTGALWGRLIQSNGTTVNYSQTSAVDLGEYFIMTNYANGSTTTGQYIRGVDASASSAYNGTVQSWVDFGVGRQGTESWDGHIAEVIVYNRSLSESERGLVENYLATKYGAEIPRLSGTTGPAGIGESDGSSRLETWFDAYDLDGDGVGEGSEESGQSGGVVSTWVDKSGHGYNLTTGSAGYTAANSGLNDMSSVDFNGSTNYLQTANINIASSNAIEYFVVFDDAASIDIANNRAMITWETAGNVGGFEFVARTNLGRMRSRHYSGGAYNDVDLNGFTTTDPYILNTRFGPSGRNHVRNGTSIASDGTSITLNNLATAPLVFGRNHSNGGLYFASEISEFISYSLELNAAERVILNHYLSTKYNIPVSGTDYYAGHDATYKYGVQGIGTSDGTLAGSHVESDASGGLTITMMNGSFNAANEYLMAGNNGASGGTVSTNLTSVPLVEERMSKVWYLDKTGTVDVKLTFNIQESVGTAHFPAGDGYVLLYSSSFPLDFQDYTADYGINAVVSDEDIAFTVPNSQLLDGYYTVGTTDPASTPLPIELLSFNANACEADVCLEWVTAVEVNNDFFEIERSADGKSWESIARLNGAGNSSEQLTYQYNDNFPMMGRSYYRLKQTDYDGAYSYSKIEKVEFSFELDFDFYPNPTENFLQIVGENLSLYTIKLQQVDGRILPSKIHVKGNNLVEIDMQRLPSGVYFLSLEYQGKSHFERIVKY